MNKQCIDCGEVKPLDDFYLRSGRPKGSDNPQHYMSYCKSCQQVRVSAPRAAAPTVIGERMVLSELLRRGIMAMPRTGFNKQYISEYNFNIWSDKYADLIAWGFITIEVKHASVKWDFARNIARFRFSFTDRQVNGEISAIVVLVCQFSETDVQYYVLPNDHPIFFSGGNRRKLLLLACGNITAEMVRAGYLSLEQIADRRGAWHLVDAKMKELVERVRTENEQTKDEIGSAEQQR